MAVDERIVFDSNLPSTSLFWLLLCQRSPVALPPPKSPANQWRSPLERRSNRAFGITRSDDEWDRRLNDRIIDHMEISLSIAFEETDTALSREKLLEQQLRENG